MEDAGCGMRDSRCRMRDTGGKLRGFLMTTTTLMEHNAANDVQAFGLHAKAQRTQRRNEIVALGGDLGCGFGIRDSKLSDNHNDTTALTEHSAKCDSRCEIQSRCRADALIRDFADAQDAQYGIRSRFQPSGFIRDVASAPDAGRDVRRNSVTL